jgi:hypothetical protein
LATFFFATRFLGAAFFDAFLLDFFLVAILFLRVGYPGLSIYNKLKKTSKCIVCVWLGKSCGPVAPPDELKTFRSTIKSLEAAEIRFEKRRVEKKD